MKEIIPMTLCAALLFGCHVRPLTPDESWSDYGHYYKPTGEMAAADADVANIRVVKSAEAEAAVASLKSQGYVALGCFKIDDGTEISHAAVAALAQKLNASAVVWSRVNTLPKSARTTSNPDMGIVGVDNVRLAQMNADRRDQSFADQVIETHHTIWMLGKKAK